MFTSSEETGNRGVVLLCAYDSSHAMVLEERLTIYDYYDGSPPMIEEDSFRRQYKIRYIRGRIFDYDGNLDQEFNTEYNEDGAYIRGCAKHSDGTTTRD